MTQDKVNAFLDRTIGTLCSNLTDIDLVILKLREKSKFYTNALNVEKDKITNSKRNYFEWYISFSNKRIQDIEKVGPIARRLGKHRPDQIFRLIKLRDKLDGYHRKVESSGCKLQIIKPQKVVKFD